MRQVHIQTQHNLISSMQVQSLIKMSTPMGIGSLNVCPKVVHGNYDWCWYSTSCFCGFVLSSVFFYCRLPISSLFSKCPEKYSCTVTPQTHWRHLECGVGLLTEYVPVDSWYCFCLCAAQINTHSVNSSFVCVSSKL